MKKTFQRRKLSLAAKENESTEDAYERRLKESQKVEERVEVVFNTSEFQKALDDVSDVKPSALALLILG